MAVIVLAGIVPGAGYFHFKAPGVRAEVIGKLRGAPGTPEEKLTLWLSYGVPQMQSRLTHLRFSSAYPWLVTHTVAVPGGEPEIWGLDLSRAEPGEVVREGLRVELRLPAPALRGHGVLRGDNADRVPHYASRAEVPDPAARAEELVRWFLGGMVEALPRDVPGAELAVVIGDPDGSPGLVPPAPVR